MTTATSKVPSSAPGVTTTKYGKVTAALSPLVRARNMEYSYLYFDLLVEAVILGWGDHEITALVPKKGDGAS